MREKVVVIIEECYALIKPGTPAPGEMQNLLPGDGLDSREFVSLIVAVEEKLELEFDQPFVLLDEAAFSRSQSPFRSITAFSDFILEQIVSYE